MVAEKNQEWYSTFLQHPIVYTLIGGVGTALIVAAVVSFFDGHKAWKSQHHALYQTVADLRGSITDDNADEFSKRARAFRAMVRDGNLPEDYGNSWHSIRSRESIIHDMIENTSIVLEDYLSYCTNKQLFERDTKQLDDDCSHDLKTFVSDNLEQLKRELYVDELKGVLF